MTHYHFQQCHFCAAFVMLFGGVWMLAQSEHSNSSFKCYLQHSRTKKYTYSNLAGLNVRIYLGDFCGSWLQKYLIQNEYFYILCRNLLLTLLFLLYVLLLFGHLESYSKSTCSLTPCLSLSCSTAINHWLLTFP